MASERTVSRCLLVATLVGVAAVCLAARGAAQRNVVQLTSSAENHQDASISPDGGTIAFRGASKIGTIGYSGGGESNLVQGANLGDFLWAPDSSGIYYLDGAVLKFVGRSGGSTVTISTLTGLSHRLWSIDRNDTRMWGTRFYGATQTYGIFSIKTSGAGGAADILTSQYALDEVRLDPSEQFLAYLRFVAGTPFAQREVFRIDVNGNNPVAVGGGLLAGNPEHMHWVDNGQSVVFSLISQTSFQPHLGRIGPLPSLQPLTEGNQARRNSNVTPDRDWVVHQAQYASGIGPAIIPSSGGGVVVLTAEDGKNYLFAGVPTADAAGVRVAFAASLLGGMSQIFRVELDRELRVYPRVEVGAPFTVDMPVKATEIGGVFLGVLGSSVLTVPGIQYGLALDPLGMVLVASGSSGLGKLSATIPVPNNPWFVGQKLILQGVRTGGASGGDFTRYAQFRIF